MLGSGSWMSQMYVHSEGLSAHGFEVREVHQPVEVERFPISIRFDCLEDLGTKPVLNILVLGEKVEDVRERVRGRVHPRDKHRSRPGVSMMHGADETTDHSRNLRDQLVIRKSILTGS